MMNDHIPKSKWERSVTGGKTAARVGGEVLSYLARKPFLSKAKKAAARETLDQKSAKAIFEGLSLLKGTALKIAQLLSMELDFFPAAIRKELEKSYNQVPPLNRALVRKAIQNGLGASPEKLFRSFDLTAFAAASLGQVHRATGPQGEPIAVKVQYPGIRSTIQNDIHLVKNLIRPLPDYDLVAPAIEEVELRLMEEIDYRQEARHLCFFKDQLNMNRVSIPSFFKNFSSGTVLSADYLEGLPLNEWIKTNPNREKKDRVAQRIHDIFLRGFYELRCIHADPNPGNFIINDDHNIGVVDFGCVKKFDERFVGLYQQLPRIVIHGDREAYFNVLGGLKFIQSDLPDNIRQEIFKTAYGFGQWIGKLYLEETFDFAEHKDFISEGRVWVNEILRYRKYIDMNPDFVYLDRTRYGLFRLFEIMGARVRIRNPYEWEA